MTSCAGNAQRARGRNGIRHHGLPRRLRVTGHWGLVLSARVYVHPAATKGAGAEGLAAFLSTRMDLTGWKIVQTAPKVFELAQWVADLKHGTKRYRRMDGSEFNFKGLELVS